MVLDAVVWTKEQNWPDTPKLVKRPVVSFRPIILLYEPLPVLYSLKLLVGVSGSNGT